MKEQANKVNDLYKVIQLVSGPQFETRSILHQSFCSFLHTSQLPHLRHIRFFVMIISYFSSLGHCSGIHPNEGIPRCL